MTKPTIKKNLRSNTPPPTTQSKNRRNLIHSGSELSSLVHSLENSTNVARSLWISFVLFGAYLLITVGSVTHVQLFYAKPITLPVFAVDLPLFAFFWFTPILFVTFHLYVLLNLNFLADQIHHYNLLLGQRRRAASDQNRAKLQLPAFFLVQTLSATDDHQRSLAGLIVRSSTFLTVAIGPILLLLFVQLQFLPYQSRFVTNLHRIAILVDVFIVWYFWQRIVQQKANSKRRIVSLGFSILVVFISVFAFVFPDEKSVKPLGEYLFGRMETSSIVGEPVRVRGLLSNALELQDLQAVSISDVERITKLEDGDNFIDDLHRGSPKVRERTLDLSGRNFSYADFSRIDLRRAKLDRANLSGADLSDAKLDWISLVDANLSHTRLYGTQINFANLGSANLQGARINSAEFRESVLDRADFRHARVFGSTFDGASLVASDMQHAMFLRSDLVAVKMSSSNMRFSSFERTDFRASTLENSVFDLANLSLSNFSGAELASTSFMGAMIVGTKLNSASLDRSVFWRATGAPNVSDTTKLVEMRLSYNPPGIHQSHFGMIQDRYADFFVEAMEATLLSDDVKVRRLLAFLDPKFGQPKFEFNWPRAMNRSLLSNLSHSEGVADVLDEVICKEVIDVAILRGVLRSYRVQNLGKRGAARLILSMEKSSCGQIERVIEPKLYKEFTAALKLSLTD